MNFPKYWAKGAFKEISCWRWSNESLAEAQASAGQAAEVLAKRFRDGNLMKRHYGYATDRPLREEVMREFRGDSGEVSAVLTRNSYGSLVLNTARIMFVDVDSPERKAKASLGGWLGRLFGGAKPAPPAPAQDSKQTELLAKVENMVRRSSEWGWRIYRTRAGFRLLATHRLFDPGADEAEPVFEELGADPLYRRLCKVQKCFRARLTPKPWRCQMNMPPSWPCPDAKEEARLKQWQTNYLAACGQYATCSLIATLGNSIVDPGIEPMVAIHDEITRINTRLPLA